MQSPPLTLLCLWPSLRFGAGGAYLCFAFCPLQGVASRACGVAARVPTCAFGDTWKAHILYRTCAWAASAAGVWWRAEISQHWAVHIWFYPSSRWMPCAAMDEGSAGGVSKHILVSPLPLSLCPPSHPLAICSLLRYRFARCTRIRRDGAAWWIQGDGDIGGNVNHISDGCVPPRCQRNIHIAALRCHAHARACLRRLLFHNIFHFGRLDAGRAPRRARSASASSLVASVQHACAFSAIHRRSFAGLI